MFASSRSTYRSSAFVNNSDDAASGVRSGKHLHRATTAVVVLALALITALSTPVSAQERVCSTKDDWSRSAGNIGYHVRLCGLPDYDQKRKAAIGLGFKKLHVFGLPVGNGACHCVPTSFTNALGYYVSKGLKVKSPANYNWNGRSFTTQNEPATPAGNQLYSTSQYPISEVGAYNSVTHTIGSVGESVRSTSDGCGTSFGAVAKDADRLFRKLSQDVSFAYNFSGADGGAPAEMASALSNGATVNFAYGTYYTTPAAGGVRIIGPRMGGHIVTLRGIKGSTGSTSGVISYRDPNTDEGVEGKVDRVRQSRFETNIAAIRKSVGSRSHWQLGPTHPDGRARFIDAWTAIYPQVLAFVDRSGFSVTGKLVNARGSLGSRAQSSAVPTVRRHFRVGRLADATYVAKTGEVAFARTGGTKLEAISIASGARRVVGKAPAGLVDLDTDARRGDVVAVGRSGIANFDLSSSAVVRRALSSRFEAVAYDPVRDRVAAVALKARKLRTFDAGSLAGGRTVNLGRSATSGAGRLALTFDAKGGLLLRRAKSGTMQRLTPRGKVRRGRLTGAHIKSGKGVVATDNGTLLSVRDGKVVELTAGGKVVKRSPFRGLAGRGTLVSVLRSAADLDPGLANQLIDRRLEGEPAFKELSANPAPGPLPGIAVLPDAAADAQMDRAP